MNKKALKTGDYKIGEYHKLPRELQMSLMETAKIWLLPSSIAAAVSKRVDVAGVRTWPIRFGVFTVAT